MDSIKQGSSLSINGICMTACALDGMTISFALSQETLNRTLARHWKPGTKLNIEPALRLGDAIDGHLVTGHVDGVGKIMLQRSQGPDIQLHIAPPPRLIPLIAEKGSIAVDGVSLTVNQTDSSSFAVTIIPWTRDNTIIGDYAEGGQVHLEVDILARYVARQLTLTAAK